MYEVIYMKADFEPWWLFEGWEEQIVERKSFEEVDQVKIHLEGLLSEFRVKYTHEATKNGAFWAFWSEDEKEYCIPCDDVLQIYHGILILKDGEPVENFEYH